MKSGNAVELSDIGKTYKIRNSSRPSTVSSFLLSRLRRGESFTDYRALHGVTAEFEEGQTVGILGRNGAGKSTLLKVIAGVVRPTTGEAAVRGRVGSLLEVGVGFHGELTGRENIWLSGSVLGLSPKEIKSIFNDIVEFSEVGQFLDTPVKRYSSGMYIRLGFSIVAFSSCEVMLVDEVLSVGDAGFQARCAERLRDLAKSGRTVFLVSHHMSTVRSMANSVMILDKGGLSYAGPAEAGIEKYTQENYSLKAGENGGDYGPGLSAVEMDQEQYRPEQTRTIKFISDTSEVDDELTTITVVIHDQMGNLIANCNSGLVYEPLSTRDKYEVLFTYRTPWLKPGVYTIDIHLHCLKRSFPYFNAATWIVSDVLPFPRFMGPSAVGTAMVFSDFDFGFEKVS
jgi:lipopolysaccharide transport system ATP-binding protein